MRSAAATPQTLDAYIASFPSDVRVQLEAVRRTIRAAAPDAVEAISYRIPTFKQDGRYLIYFAGYRTHIGVYPVEVESTELGQRLAPYASGKATLKFALDRPIPLDLIAQVVRWKLRRTAGPPARTRSGSTRTEPLAVVFTAVIEHSGSPGGWCYVVWPQSAGFFGTHGLVKVEAVVDGVPMTTAFMALGDGRHKLPIKAAVRRAIGKQAGDRVKVELRARLR